MTIFRTIRDYFLPQRSTTDEDSRRDAGIFIALLLISGVADLLGISLARQVGSAAITWTLLANGLICFGLAFLYKRGANKWVLGHIFIAQHGIAFCVQAWFQGGLISPANASFFLLPAVAMLSLGKRSAMFWLITTVLALIGFYLFEQQFGAPQGGVDPSMRKYLFFSGIVSTNITIFIILLVYENTKSNAIAKARKRNDEIERQKQQIQTQNDKLKELHREVFEQKKLRDRFFAIIAHDLRGSVTSFKAISDVIAMYVEDRELDKLRRVMPDMDQTTQQLVRLLDNLLNWASQELREIPYHPETINIWQMVNDLIQGLRALALSKSVEIVSHVDKDLSLWADPNSTFTIFRNLIHNALKFTNSGGRIEISAIALESGVEVSVTDTGVGMTEDTLKNVFKLEDRSSTYGTQGEKGIGLGLQLVQEFTKLNNGRVEVESVPNKGTTFKIILPAEKVEASL